MLERAAPDGVEDVRPFLWTRQSLETQAETHLERLKRPGLLAPARGGL